MSKTLVFGHQNPDADTIEAAIAFSHLQNELGKETKAVALGTPNEETQYALDHSQLSAPRVIESVKAGNVDIMFVDHNEFQQNISDISEVNILAVVDHHHIANFEAANPSYYRAGPVGCTSMIILKLYKKSQVTIPKEIAGIILSTIISDTLLFRSPTCTPEDEAAAKELATIVEADLNTYGLETLKAGTDLSDKSVVVLLDLDAKSFPMGSSNVRIAQVNTVDLNEVMDRQTELGAVMEDEMETNDYDLFVLVITDILDSDSELLVTGKGKGEVEEAFQTALTNSRALLRGVISCKKQVVPQLTTVFS